VRIANLENLDDLSTLIAQLRSDAPPAAADGAGVSLSNSAKKKAELTPSRNATNGALADTSHAAAESVAVRPEGAVQLTDETLEAIWKETLANLSDLLAENAALCESVALREPNRLVVTFRAKYTSCKGFCERPEQLAKLESALSAVAAGAVKVEFELLKEEPLAAPAGRRGPGNRQRLAEKAEHPLVRRATELFDARLVRIEEPGDK
jgi:hypothetical protein